MDISGVYRGGDYRRYISPKEIEKMKKNMKKVPIIESKSNKYHLKEKQEAEQLLDKLHTNNKK